MASQKEVDDVEVMSTDSSSSSSSDSQWRRRHRRHRRYLYINASIHACADLVTWKRPRESFYTCLYFCLFHDSQTAERDPSAGFSVKNLIYFFSLLLLILYNETEKWSSRSRFTRFFIPRANIFFPSLVTPKHSNGSTVRFWTFTRDSLQKIVLVIRSKRFENWNTRRTINARMRFRYITPTNVCATRYKNTTRRSWVAAGRRTMYRYEGVRFMAPTFRYARDPLQNCPPQPRANIFVLRVMRG